MRIVNKSGHDKYMALVDRKIAAGTRTHDIDVAGFLSSLRSIVKSCGSSFSIVLSEEEKSLISKITAMDTEGSKIKIAKVSEKRPMNGLLIAEEREKRAKMASIEAAVHREEAINNEATYVNSKDKAAAAIKSGKIRGEVSAKKLSSEKAEMLNESMATSSVSLSDLMGDNRFIEESMKSSKVPTAVASEEGWDMKKMNEAKESKESKESKDIKKEVSVDEDSKKPSKSARGRKSKV